MAIACDQLDPFAVETLFIALCNKLNTFYKVTSLNLLFFRKQISNSIESKIDWSESFVNNSKRPFFTLLKIYWSFCTDVSRNQKEFGFAFDVVSLK